MLQHMTFALLFLLMPTLATAQTEIRVLAAGAVTPTVKEIVDTYTRASGTKVVITSDTAGGLQNPGVRVVGTIPASIQLPTIYTAAILTTNANMAAARAFLQMLASAEGAAVLKRAGLEPLSGAR